MARSHTMTPARRAALKKAQAASARKRRGKGKGKLAAANRKNRPMSKKRRAGRILASVAYVAAVGYATNIHGNAAYLYREHQASRTRKRKAKIAKNWAAHDAHLKKMKYGVSGYAPSQRVKPMKALTR